MIPSEHLKDAMSAINDHVRDLEEQLAASQARVAELEAISQDGMPAGWVLTRSEHDPWWFVRGPNAELVNYGFPSRWEAVETAKRHAEERCAVLRLQELGRVEAQRDAAREEARQAQARVKELEQRVDGLDFMLRDAEAECERLRAIVSDARCAVLCMRVSGTFGRSQRRELLDRIDAALAGASAPPEDLRQYLANGPPTLTAEEQAFADDLASAPPVRDESVPPPGWHWAGVDGRYVCRGSSVMSPRSYKLAEAWACYDVEHGYAPVSAPQEPASGDGAPDAESDAEAAWKHAAQYWLREYNRLARKHGEYVHPGEAQEPAPAASPSEPACIVCGNGFDAWVCAGQPSGGCEFSTRPCYGSIHDQSMARGERLSMFAHDECMARMQARLFRVVEQEHPAEPCVIAWTPDYCCDYDDRQPIEIIAGAAPSEPTRAQVPTRESEDAVEGKLPAVPPLPDGWQKHDRRPHEPWTTYSSGRGDDGSYHEIELFDDGTIDIAGCMDDFMASDVFAVLSHHLARKAADQ
jgi:hypothetical protein